MEASDLVKATVDAILQSKEFVFVVTPAAAAVLCLAALQSTGSAAIALRDAIRHERHWNKCALALLI